MSDKTIQKFDEAKKEARSELKKDVKKTREGLDELNDVF